MSTLETMIGEEDVASLVPPPSGSAAIPRRRRRRASVALAGLWLFLVAILAATASWLPLAEYDLPIDSPHVRPGFRLDEPLGTDELGRSLLSRSIYGARVSLVVGFASVVLAMLVGGAAGVLSGYFRGKTDVVVRIVTDTFLAFPPLILLLALASALRPSLPNLVMALALLTLPTFTRLSRANTLGTVHKDYVVAARALGSSHVRTLRREIVPNVILPIASYCFVVAAVVIVAEGSLSFLGLGIPPPNPSWGGMIAAGRSRLQTEPHLVFVPATMMFLTIFSCNVVGDALRRRFDTRQSVLT